MTATHSAGLDAVFGSLRQGRPVVVSHGDRRLLAAPAALSDEALLHRFEALTSAPVQLALDSAVFDSLGLGDADQLPPQDSPVGLPIDIGSVGIDAMSRRARAATMRAVGQGDLSDVRTPGHVPTVRSSPGNLLSRVGLIEAAVDLVKLAGFRDSAIIAFLVDECVIPDDCVSVEASEVRTASLAQAGGVPTDEVKSLFISAMSRLVAPVAVITTAVNGNDPHGLVVSSLTSYSSEPPSVVFSVALSARSYQALHDAERFAVHILAHGQDDLVGAFASRGTDKFVGLDWEMRHGVPVLEGAQTQLVCRKIGELKLGDHALFVGAIIDGHASERDPMTYFDRKFTWELSER